MRILLHEDEHIIRRALSEHLGALHHEVLEVGSDLELFQILKQGAYLPDLIVLSKTEIIPQLEALKIRTPLLILSASPPGELLGRYSYIEKPYELSDVSAWIDSRVGYFSK